MRRVVIAGGGTGGHLFPGVALAEAVLAAGGEVLFVGSPHGIETRVIPELGHRLELVDVRGIKGRGLRGLLGGLVRLPRALGRSLRLLRGFAPDAVVGVGGYASGPVVAAAALMGLRTAILEQNSVPGITNRILARLVDRVFCTFADRRDRFPADKVVLAGNPIRGALRAWTEAPGPAQPGTRLFVFGGSQGARAINDAMIAAAPVLARTFPELELWHQTGVADRDRVEQAYRDAGFGARARVDAFVRDMTEPYRFATLALCRAGATSLSELMVVGLPALLVPFPHATDDHQTENARDVVAAGAAVLVPQAELDADRLVGVLSELLHDPRRLAGMSARMKSLARPSAAEDILAELSRI